MVSSILSTSYYGSVGALSWNNPRDFTEFGADPNPTQLVQLAHKIKTFTEGTDPNSSDIVAIKEHMSTADKLVFIGFAFHKLNMQLITPDHRNEGKKPRCFATTYGISNSDKDVVLHQIANLYKALIDVKMASVTCNKFFSEFWRSLSF